MRIEKGDGMYGFTNEGISSKANESQRTHLDEEALDHSSVCLVTKIIIYEKVPG